MIATLFWLCVGSIIYTYLGYPVLLALLARARPGARAYSAATPTVTLLIAAYNEQAIIAEKLDNSLALDYPPDRLQILVAADGSDDRTPEIVRAYAGRGVELSYSLPRRGKMAAINRAMRLARGEIVVFSDANNTYASDVLHELVAPFSDPSVGAVTGAKVIVPGDGALGETEGLYWRYESFIKEQETRLGCCAGVSGEVLAIRRELFEAPSDSIINDDTYMAMRLIRRGYCVIYAPGARSTERVSASAQDEIARRARIFAGRYQAIALAYKVVTPNRPLVLWQVVSHQYLRTLIAPAMVGALATNLLVLVRPRYAATRRLRHLAPPANWLMLVLQLSFYALAWIGSRGERRGAAGRLLYIPTFLVNSNLASIIGLYRFLTRRQTPLWQRVNRRNAIAGLK